MRILVIGGTNFIGPYVVSSLLEGGHEVTLFNRGKSRAEPPHGVGRITGDRTNLVHYREEFRRLAPDVVVDMFALNEHDARGLVDTFAGIAGRMVVISSIDVYRAYDIVRKLVPGPPDPMPLTEDSPLRDRLYPYQRAVVEEYEKILVERTVGESLELPSTVLRLPAVYGPGDYQHRMYEYVRRMQDGRPAIILHEGFAGWRFTHGYVEDVAAAVGLVATDERASGRIYNVGEAETSTWKERVGRLGEAFGWSGEVLSVPETDLPDHLKVDLNSAQDWEADTSSLRRELGYEEVVTSESALRSTVSWEGSNPPKDGDLTRFDYPAEDVVLERLL